MTDSNNLNMPVDVLTAIDNYLIQGWDPGGFTTAVLAGDLFEAVGRADYMSKEYLSDIAKWIKWNVPREAYGSYENVKDWIANKDDRRSKWALWQTLTHTE